jgi:hypothetical protein
LAQNPKASSLLLRQRASGLKPLEAEAKARFPLLLPRTPDRPCEVQHRVACRE